MNIQTLIQTWWDHQNDMDGLAVAIKGKEITQSEVEIFMAQLTQLNRLIPVYPTLIRTILEENLLITAP